MKRRIANTPILLTLALVAGCGAAGSPARTDLTLGGAPTAMDPTPEATADLAAGRRAFEGCGFGVVCHTGGTGRPSLLGKTRARLKAGLRTKIHDDVRIGDGDLDALAAFVVTAEARGRWVEQGCVYGRCHAGSMIDGQYPFERKTKAELRAVMVKGTPHTRTSDEDLDALVVWLASRESRK
jgi:hypothetical protein